MIDDPGFFETPRAMIAHAVWLDAAEADLIARRPASVAHNTVPNMKLAGGIAPVAELPAAGAPVGLGTDGEKENNNFDMSEALKAASLMGELRHRDAAAMEPWSCLEVGTRLGAKAIGLDAAIGSLGPGKRADLIAVAKDTARMTPFFPHGERFDLQHNLVHAVRGSDVALVMVDGQVGSRTGGSSAVTWPSSSPASGRSPSASSRAARPGWPRTAPCSKPTRDRRRPRRPRRRHPVAIEGDPTLRMRRLGQDIDAAPGRGALPDGRALPVRVKGGLTFTTLGRTARDLSDIAEAAEDDRRFVPCGRVTMSASCLGVVENVLDMAHLPCIHTNIPGAEPQTGVPAYQSGIRRGGQGLGGRPARRATRWPRSLRRIFTRNGARLRSPNSGEGPLRMNNPHQTASRTRHGRAQTVARDAAGRTAAEVAAAFGPGSRLIPGANGAAGVSGVGVIRRPRWSWLPRAARSPSQAR